MATWLLGSLMLILVLDIFLDWMTARGGLLRRCIAAEKGSRLGNWFYPLAVFPLFLLVTVGWIAQFPTELVMEGIEPPYGEFDYLIGPAPEGVGLFGEMRFRCAVALHEVADALRSFESFVQPLFVKLYEAMSWARKHMLLLLGIIVGVELLCAFIFKRRGPVRKLLGAFFDSDARLGKIEGMLLPGALFFAITFWYFSTAFYKEAEEPRQKVMPLISDIIDSFREMAIQSNELWADTWATSLRFLIALVIIMLAIPVGVAMARFPRFDALLHRFTLWGADKINAFAILVLVFIVLKTGEHTRIMLAVLAVAPTVALDAAMRAGEVPKRLIERTKSFGATDFEVAFRRIFKMIFPAVMNTIRLNIKVIVGVLILSETIGAMYGLGLRISLAGRHTVTDDIIVMNIMFLVGLIAVDSAIKLIIRKTSPWYKL